MGLDHPNQLFPLDDEEMEMVTEIIQAEFNQVCKEMREERPVLSRCLPWFFNPTFSASRTGYSLSAESIERPYSYYLK